MLPDREARAQRDQTAIARFLSGDEDGFAELVRAYQDTVHQFVRAFLGRAVDAEDIAQEVFVQAYRSLSRFRGDSRFSTWLYSIARHVCLHRIRKNSADLSTAMDPHCEQWLALPDREPGQDALLEKAEMEERMRRALDELPVLYRTVVVLSYWEDLPYAEIAQILEIPVGTVKSRMHNALALLADKLRPQAPREEGAR